MIWWKRRLKIYLLILACATAFLVVIGLVTHELPAIGLGALPSMTGYAWGLFFPQHWRWSTPRGIGWRFPWLYDQPPWVGGLFCLVPLLVALTLVCAPLPVPPLLWYILRVVGVTAVCAMSAALYFDEGDPPKWREGANKKVRELVAKVKAVHGTPRGLPTPA